ncbi:MAG TPA: helix-turn-helix domain-containing protein [Actinomycetota bacterium]|nr:helix-turn-helix domain-containing protein [Actinomycetota bacterium]
MNIASGRGGLLLTTSEAAAICGMGLNTVIRAMDRGILKGGFRIPGSTHRRIPVEALRQFMIETGIPTERLDRALEDPDAGGGEP